jgi:hypothetical protein
MITTNGNGMTLIKKSAFQEFGLAAEALCFALK